MLDVAGDGSGIWLWTAGRGVKVASTSGSAVIVGAGNGVELGAGDGVGLSAGEGVGLILGPRVELMTVGVTADRAAGLRSLAQALRLMEMRARSKSRATVAVPFLLLACRSRNLPLAGLLTSYLLSLLLAC